MTTDSAYIKRFEEAKARFDSLRKPQLGMRSVLEPHEKQVIDDMMSEVFLFALLDHLAAAAYECADAVGADCEGGQWLLQQASVVSAAALFCKTWEPFK